MVVLPMNVIYCKKCPDIWLCLKTTGINTRILLFSTDRIQLPGSHRTSQSGYPCKTTKNYYSQQCFNL